MVLLLWDIFPLCRKSKHFHNRWSFWSLWPVTHSVVDKSIGHAKPHFDFFTTISASKKICFFFRASAEKGIKWHLDPSSVVWTLIDNGKLIANQIARLVEMVVNTYVLTIGKSSLLQTLKKNSSTFPNSQLETVWLVFDTVKSFGLLLHFFYTVSRFRGESEPF